MAAGKPVSDSVLTLRRNENGRLVTALPALPARYRFAAGFRPAVAAAGSEERFLPVEKMCIRDRSKRRSQADGQGLGL